MRMHFVVPLGLLAAVLAFPAAPTAQTPIAFGQTLVDSLCNGSVRSFQFVGHAGDVILVHACESQDLGGSCSPACCCADQLLVLRGSAGVVAMNSSGVQGNSCGNLTRTALGPVLLPSDDTYTLEVSDANSFGGSGYSLWLQNLSSPVGATQIPAHSSTLVDVQPAGAVRTFTFAGGRNARLDVNVVAEPGSSVLPRVGLYLDGAPMALPPDGVISMQLPTAGRYTLLTRSAGPESGAYRVNVDHSPAPISIWPGNGEAPRSTAFDLVVVVRNTGLAVAGGSIRLDGVDVTGSAVATQVGNRLVLRWNGLTASGLGVGTHTLRVDVSYVGGTSASESVEWNVLL